MKIYKNLIGFLFILLISSNVFADDWYVCMGSFRVKSNAQNRAALLQQNGIDAAVTKFKLADDTFVYRVLMRVPFTREEEAKLRRDQMQTRDLLKKLQETNLWYCVAGSENFLDTVVAQDIIRPEQENNAHEADAAADGESGTQTETPAVQSGPQTVQPDQVGESPGQNYNYEPVWEQVITVVKPARTNETSRLSQDRNTLPNTAVEDSDVAQTVSATQSDSASVARQQEPETLQQETPFYIMDSDTGAPVVYALVRIDQKWERTSDDKGMILLPMELENGVHLLHIEKPGSDFLPLDTEFTISSGFAIGTTHFALPHRVDFERVKIVLTWGESPSDLDSHILSPAGHVYFSRQDWNNLHLDHDDTTSYGPETVTIENPDPLIVYKYFVYNYSDGGNDDWSERLSNSGAEIQVYIDNEFKQTFRVQPGQQGVTWHVFDVVNGKDIIPVDIVYSQYVNYDGE